MFQRSYHTSKPGLVQLNFISCVVVSHSVTETNTIQEDSLMYFSENELTALKLAYLRQKVNSLDGN